LLPRLPDGGGGLATIYHAPKGTYIQLWPTVQRAAPSATPLMEEELHGPIKRGQRTYAVGTSTSGVNAVTDQGRIRAVGVFAPTRDLPFSPVGAG
jgi:hypothetical protein